MDCSRIYADAPPAFSDAQAAYHTAQRIYLNEALVGKHLNELHTPTAIIDRAVVKRNCQAMLNLAKSLGLKFRAHVKTHKTLEISQLQVGPTGPINLVVSTLAEIEILQPWLTTASRKENRPVNVLYGIPAPPSTLPRLYDLATKIGANSISLMLDHPSLLQQIKQLCASRAAASNSPSPVKFGIMVKVDTGYHRAGLGLSNELQTVLSAVLEAEKDPLGYIQLQGLYSHSSLAYASDSPDSALSYALSEITGLASAASIAHEKVGLPAGRRLTLSYGATPSATAIQTLLDGSAKSATIRKAEETISKVLQSHDVEVHAGVYTTLDLQQLAAAARPSELPAVATTTKDAAAENASLPTPTAAPTLSAIPLNTSALAFRILAEVASVYTDRSEPEALIAAGTLALGREPCKEYSGWGVVTEWPEEGKKDEPKAPFGENLWYVDRVSQEHGILRWKGDAGRKRDLKVGQKVLLWPNHACIAAAGFGWFVVVDSEGGKEDEVVDVWIRARGW